MQKKYDLIVAGGGLAGVAAAISAAREGLRVLLFDRNNALGGAATECLVNPFMRYWAENLETGERTYLSKSIFTEILDNLEALGGILEDRRTFHEEYLKLVLTRMCLEAKVVLLFNTYLADAETENGTIKRITVVNKSGKEVYEASYFVDATGDGDLAVFAGCGYQLGREGDALCQPMTLCFRLLDVDIPKYYEEKPEIQKLYQEWQESGKIKNPRENVLTFPYVTDNILHFNSTRIVKKNPTSGAEITEAEIEAREQAFALYDFLRKNFTSFRNAKMLQTASRIGVRESRMIKGEYVLTKEDILSYTKFDDGIAACTYNIDIHSPDGKGTIHYRLPANEYYTIPYRCLTPKATTNLLVTGRCLSSTHEAQASYRIMPTCASTGEAAGLAAAIAYKKGVCVKGIPVQELRNKIRSYGGKVD